MINLLAPWFLVATAAVAPVSLPQETVQAAVTRTVELLQDAVLAPPEAGEGRGRLTQMDRTSQLRAVSDALFDVDTMAQRVLGRHWGARSDSERQEFTRLFAELVHVRYAALLERHVRDRFAFSTERNDGSSAVIRSTAIDVRNSRTVTQYRLQRHKQAWKAYDLAVDGVSLVATYRQQVDKVLRRSSYAALADQIRRQLTALRADGVAASPETTRLAPARPRQRR